MEKTIKEQLLFQILIMFWGFDCLSYVSWLKKLPEKIGEFSFSRMSGDFILPYLVSIEEYEIRFGVVMLIDYYMEEEYMTQVLQQRAD
ncbi:hypothetical protein Back11_08290 [Paenibacillus baekrokdamisoli]|uniref:Uncharacterized protein n=1 Tax=Paenibacillus baekrokdamisoli TaxID=1712516 RepID=A0A3G9J882_9BACL|nr:hypothetical protein [Paenibacillus baekrokdamisoli]BBH19484.1 hypothetical protein Back11_08290 [Paenibacillus baekrokdamisoli]